MRVIKVMLAIIELLLQLIYKSIQILVNKQSLLSGA